MITPLRHQQLLIRDRLHAMTTPPHTAAMTTPPHTSADVARELSGVDVSLVEVSTVDRYQGRDKKCIIVSFVRSNRKGNVSPCGVLFLSPCGVSIVELRPCICIPNFWSVQIGREGGNSILSPWYFLQ